MNNKFIIVVAGPNGSGKSSTIGAVSEVHDVQYICPDNHIHLFNDIESIEDRYDHAMKAAEQDRLTAVEIGDSFAFETVCSNPEKLDFILDARSKGYRIIVLYISTEDPEINIARVRRRVTDGGHDVPDEKVVDRYHRSLKLLPDLLKLADEALVYDNSDENKLPRFFIKIERGLCFSFRPIPVCKR